MRAVWFLALVACTAPPVATKVAAVETGRTTATIAHTGEATVSSPRPPLDLSAVMPDPIPRGRWPLTPQQHPTSDPQFPIASALAEPRIAWNELCHLGAQHRHISGDRDLQRYLHAWCAVERRDVPTAISELSAIGSPMVSGLAAAIVVDIANLLSQDGSADHAEHVLAALQLRDVQLLDVLAAFYVELGRTGDALEINQLALDQSPREPDLETCHRLARRIVLAPKAETFLGDERRLGQAADPECRNLRDELACWVDGAKYCGLYLNVRSFTPEQRGGYRVLIEAHRTWPTYAVTVRVWLALARSLDDVDVPGADLFETEALVAAMRAVACAGNEIPEIRRLATNVRTRSGHAPTLDPRLDAVIGRLDAMMEASTLQHCHELDRRIP